MSLSIHLHTYGTVRVCNCAWVVWLRFMTGEAIIMTPLHRDWPQVRVTLTSYMFPAWGHRNERAHYYSGPPVHQLSFRGGKTDAGLCLFYSVCSSAQVEVVANWWRSSGINVSPKLAHATMSPRRSILLVRTDHLHGRIKTAAKHHSIGNQNVLWRRPWVGSRPLAGSPWLYHIPLSPGQLGVAMPSSLIPE